MSSRGLWEPEQRRSQRAACQGWKSSSTSSDHPLILSRKEGSFRKGSKQSSRERQSWPSSPPPQPLLSLPPEPRGAPGDRWSRCAARANPAISLGF